MDAVREPGARGSRWGHRDRPDVLGHGARILLVDLERGNLHVDERGLNVGVPHQPHQSRQADAGAHHIGGKGVPETVRVGKFHASSLGAVTFDGKLYGVPIEGTQPVYFFYNKTIFAHLGLTFPTTFSGLLAAVSTLKSHGYSPISLANGDQWPGLMYLEYLTDRIGGPGVFQAIELGKPGAWSNPAVIKALADIQQLAKAGAFQSG